MSDLITEFNDYRAKMNEKLLADDNKVIKRNKKTHLKKIGVIY